MRTASTMSSNEIAQETIKQLRAGNAALRAACDGACNVMDALRERADRISDEHAVRALLGARNMLRAALADKEQKT